MVLPSFLDIFGTRKFADELCTTTTTEGGFTVHIGPRESKPHKKHPAPFAGYGYRRVKR